MDTFFASPERESDSVIAEQIQFISNNPVIDAVLNASGGIVAVLNEKRQVLAANEVLLSYLKIDNTDNLLGLRPGEVLKCVHADELPAGCGTSSWCSACGAAIAIVTSLAERKPVEQKCVITVKKDGTETELCFSVRSAIVSIENEKLILLFLKDISLEEQRASLERMFSHDMKNILTGITCSAEMLDDISPALVDSVNLIKKLAVRLRSEIMLHASFFSSGKTEYVPEYQLVKTRSVINEMIKFFSIHSSSFEKSLTIQDEIPDCVIKTDYSLLMRVLTNLITNAFEATPHGGIVKLSCEIIDKTIVFEIWNCTSIPPEISKRVFQQYFSTKKGDGRGLGSFGSKYICERLLKGTLQFTSSEQHGTTFTVALPTNT